MKLRKTVYPLALIISIPLVLVVFFILNQGKFEKIVAETWTVEELQKKDIASLHIDLEWNGLGKPKLTSITFSGNPDMEMHAHLELKPGIALAKEVVEVEPETYTIQLDETQLKEKHVTLILEVEQANKYEIPGNAIYHIRYKSFGIMKEQELQIK